MTLEQLIEIYDYLSNRLHNLKIQRQAYQHRNNDSKCLQNYILNDYAKEITDLQRYVNNLKTRIDEIKYYLTEIDYIEQVEKEII